MVGRVLTAGIQIGPREAKVLGVVFNCSVSAIQADVKELAKMVQPPNTNLRQDRPT